MNSQVSNTHQQNQTPGVNPFARALAEARGAQGGTDGFGSSMDSQFNNPSQLGNGYLNESSDYDQMEQQQLQAEKMRHDRLREQLHRQINPVESTDVYNARQQQVSQQIDEIRHELKLLGTEVAEFNKEIEISVMANVPNPGQTGAYYFAFFKQLKEFIILLRNKIHSARTWATTMNSKKQKRNAPGMEISGQQHEQTATIFDRMHHERATQFSGS